MILLLAIALWALIIGFLWLLGAWRNDDLELTQHVTVTTDYDPVYSVYDGRTPDELCIVGDGINRVAVMAEKDSSGEHIINVVT